MAAENISNEEIRQQLINYGYNSGPVTGTTRAIHLRKLEELQNNKQLRMRNISVNIEASVDSLTDDGLREQLLAYGQTVAPISSVNRDIYRKRLVKLRSENNSINNNSSNKNKRKERSSVDVTDGSYGRGNENWDDESEPMEID